MTKRLTSFQVQMFKLAFELFDSDGSGTISIKQLGIIMRSLGQNPTENDLYQIIRDVQSRKQTTKSNEQFKGSLNIQQFLGLMANQLELTQNQKELKQIFKIFDLDGDGLLSAMEIKEVMNNLGEKIKIEDAKAMVAQADLDGDEYVNYQEFVRMMKRK